MAPTLLEAIKQALLGKAANAAIDEAKPYVDRAIESARPPQEAITPGARMIDGYPSMSSGLPAQTSGLGNRQDIPGVRSGAPDPRVLQEMLNEASAMQNRDKTYQFVRDNTVNPIVEKQGAEITAAAQQLMKETEGKGDPQGAIATAVLQKAQQQQRSKAKGTTLTDRQYADTINAMPEPQQSQYISQFGAPVVGAKDVAEGVNQEPEEPSIFDSMGDKISEFFGNEEKMLNLALAFNTLRYQPDQALASSISKRLEKLQDQRGYNKTIEAWKRSKDPNVQKALQYYEATKDMKGAAKLAYGTDTTYGTTPRLIRNKKTGEQKWVQLSSAGGQREVDLGEGWEVAPAYDKIDAGTYWILKDQTGMTIGYEPKNLTAAAAQTQLGKDWAESIGGGQKTVDNLSEGVAAIDWVLDPSRADVLSRGFGLTGEYLPTILPETKDLYAKMNQIGAKQFLAGFESLKGGGQISNIEGGQAKQAGLALFDEEGKLKTGLSPAYVREQLTKLRDIYQRGIERARQGLRIKPGYNPMTDNENDFLEPVGGAQQGVPTSPMGMPTAPTNPYAGFSIAR